MRRFFIEFNNCRDIDLKLYAMHRPSIPCPERKIEETEILGRDGTLIKDYGTYNNIEIEVEYNFIDRKDFNNKNRLIRKWINNIEDNKLVFSDNADYYYKVKYCKLDVIERTYKSYGTFTLTFICEPFQYVIDNNIIAIKNGQTIMNEGYTCKPTYKLSGEGLVKLKINNNEEVSIQLGQETTIDTELMLCYRAKEQNNTIMAGEYKDLYLDGYSNNTISWTGNITRLEITPNYREI